MKNTRYPYFSAWLVCALIVAGCAEEVVIEAASPRPVYTHVVGEPVASTPRSFSGIVSAAEGTDLGFELGGRIVSMRAEEGSHHDAGDVLAAIDATGIRADLNNAQAQFAASDAQLQRTLRLFENDNASRAQLDSAMASRETAKANLDIAQKRLRDTTLRMPYPGVIGIVDADAQQIVSAGERVLTIRGEAGLEMEVGVPARLIEHIHTGLKASIKLGPFPDRTYTGTVTQVSPQISDNTTYGVTVAFDETPPEALEGMDGEATIAIPNESGSTVLVPLAGVGRDGGGSAFAWVITELAGGKGTKPLGTAARREVTVGQVRNNAFIEVPTGLKPGEVIVTRGLHQVEAGATVVIAPEYRN